jgi:hypothetical protein
MSASFVNAMIMRAYSANRAHVAYPTHLSCQRLNVRSRHVSLVAKAAKDPGLFEKIGTQLVKAGSRLTDSLSGTAKLQRRGAGKDNVVFIAGSSGRLGSKILVEAVRAGFTVRAGCRTAEKGEALIESLRESETLNRRELSQIQLVEFDLFEKETLAPAIGNAGAHHSLESCVALGGRPDPIPSQQCSACPHHFGPHLRS